MQPKHGSWGKMKNTKEDTVFIDCKIFKDPQSGWDINLAHEHYLLASNLLSNYKTVIHHMSDSMYEHLSLWGVTAGSYQYHHYFI